jgi:hypothetical protein
MRSLQTTRWRDREVRTACFVSATKCTADVRGTQEIPNIRAFVFHVFADSFQFFRHLLSALRCA